MVIAVLMACYNRRNHTIRCLNSLKSQSIICDGTGHKRCRFNLWLLDDASSDGTSEAVRAIWPDVNVIDGDGNSYWCGGMRRAWRDASASDPDFYLLLNDDTTLVHDAIEQLLALAPEPNSQVIAVAAIADPRDGRVVFGGHKGHNLAPVQPEGTAENCDTMNANCALVPRAVYEALGILSDAYTHSMGDFDYGFMARRSGVQIIQSASILGFSEPNPQEGSWRDCSLSRIERLKLLWFSPTKGLPFFEWFRYCYRNYGWRLLYKGLSPTGRVIIGK